MSNSEFAELCKTCFTELFAKAKESNQTQFLTSFFAFERKTKLTILSYIPEYELREVIELLNTFDSIQDDENVAIKNRTRTRILLYCHIIEIDLLYLIILNMIRTIKKQNYSPKITFVSKKQNIVEAEKLFQKIYSITKESDGIEIRLKELYDEIYSPHLRNAFSHSQYFLDEDGDFHISRLYSPISPEKGRKNIVQTTYTVNEIAELYQKALTYLKMFNDAQQQSITEFMDGNAYDTIYGKILYNHLRRWVFKQNQ